MRAESLGKKGIQWLAGLDEQVNHLTEQWSIRVEEVLAGGSEGLVAHALLADGRAAVLKIGLPGSADLSTEAKVYGLAAGRGYAELFAYDSEQNAILLEQLGARLGTNVTTIDSQIQVICRTLQEAWLPLDSAHELMTGAEKAAWLASFINERWRLLGHPCDKRTIDRALSFAEERIHAYSPDDSVLVHGDAHAHNTLLSDPQTLLYKFIDPDGLFAEKACDLAVPMRDWSHELLAGDALRLCRERCELLAELTHVDARAIWQWGFIERVSTGLVLLEIGMKTEGVEMLAVADLLSSHHDLRSPRTMKIRHDPLRLCGSA
jgi:streptomycin 6-kinase